MRAEIQVQDLGKKFHIYHAGRPTRIKQILLHGFRSLKPLDSFWGLKNISFQLNRGDMVGIIGPNGSGKSTLLKLVGGVGRQDTGTITTTGRISGLIDLGAGYHPELTGRQNIFLNAIIAGLTRKEVIHRFDSIVSFSELEEFLDNPFRTYSSGMQMRLAFAVAVHTEPDILLIDEVLSVGDYSFQEKSIQRIRDINNQGCTVLFVSHDLKQIEELCHKAIWLKKGELMAEGEPGTIIKQYTEEMSANTRRKIAEIIPPTTASNNETAEDDEHRTGTREIEIIAVHLLGIDGTGIPLFNSGDAFNIEIEYRAHREMSNPIFGISISDVRGNVICDMHTVMSNIKTGICKKSGKVALHIDQLDLCNGDYFVDVGIYEQQWEHIFDYHWHLYPIKVSGHHSSKGIYCPSHRWNLDDTNT